jgi:hypothetical protein
VQAGEVLSEGWYLMSPSSLERELRRVRNPDLDLPPSGAARLTIEEALAYRNAGNLPDGKGRTLRLVLVVQSPDDLASLDRKRLLYEPDFHSVTVVPLRDPHLSSGSPRPWWEEPELAALEREWEERGTVAGMRVPGAYRGFVYKTVLALRSAGVEVTPQAVCDSVARWLDEPDIDRLRKALLLGP